VVRWSLLGEVEPFEESSKIRCLGFLWDVFSWLFANKG